MNHCLASRGISTRRLGRMRRDTTSIGMDAAVSLFARSQRHLATRLPGIPVLKSALQQGGIMHGWVAKFVSHCFKTPEMCHEFWSTRRSVEGIIIQHSVSASAKQPSAVSDSYEKICAVLTESASPDGLTRERKMLTSADVSRIRHVCRWMAVSGRNAGFSKPIFNHFLLSHH